MLESLEQSNSFVKPWNVEVSCFLSEIFCKAVSRRFFEKLLSSVFVENDGHLEPEALVL